MRARIRWNRLLHFTAAALCLLPFGARAGDFVVGQVTAVTGRATAQQPNGEARVLACGDFVYTADRLVTADGASLGLMLGDALTQMTPGTTVRLDVTSAGAPDATLERGRVRMVDPRDEGPPIRLAALDTEAAVVGNDVEAYVLSEKIGPYAMFCEWDSPLAATRGSEQLTADSGECVIAKPTEPLYVARAHDERIDVASAEECGVDPAILASLASDPVHHLSPGDVAAPPPGLFAGNAGLGSGNPDLPAVQTVYQCDSAAGGCGAFPSVSVFPVETAPGGGTAPGSIGPLP